MMAEIGGLLYCNIISSVYYYVNITRVYIYFGVEMPGLETSAALKPRLARVSQWLRHCREAGNPGHGVISHIILMQHG